MKLLPSPFARLRIGAVVLLFSVLGPILGQAQIHPPGVIASGQPSTYPQLPRFDFEFHGGSPGELVKELNKAAGTNINLIIPDGVEDVRIPKLNLAQVTVPDVLYGLNYAGSAGRGQIGVEWVYQFQLSSPGGPTPAWSGVWMFSAVRNQSAIKPNSSLKVFSLARYLGKPEQGLHSVDDIITAVQTGWKMQKISPLPELTYHPETKLLMAYGQDAHLTLITDVLKQLEPPVPAPVQKEKVNPEVMKALEKGGLVMPQEPTKSK